jgi:Domain of unknown function (DUF1887)
MNSIRYLIHLVSEQTMPNLLPLLALRPQRVIQICGSDPKIRQSAQRLEAAAREAGSDAEFQIHEISSTSPRAEEIKHAHKQLLSIFPGGVVNLTGGTKLMSIGAYLGASEFHDVPILYCDTASKAFVQVGKNSLPPWIPTFYEVVRTLTLRIIMAAHGNAPASWRFDTAGDSLLEFGNRSWQLRTRHPEDFQSCRFGDSIRNFYRSDRGKIPSSADKLKALLEADLTSAIAGELSEPITSFLAAAAAAGLLNRLASGGFRLADGPSGKDKLRSHVERIANLLDGSWLELSVLDFITRSPLHLDPHWSVEPLGADSTAYGETDLIAVNARHAALEIISCKTSLKQPLEHLEGLRTRANNLGGSHALATLAILHAGNPAEQERLRRWGRLLRVTILSDQEIPLYFSKPL